MIEVVVSSLPIVLKPKPATVSLRWVVDQREYSQSADCPAAGARHGQSSWYRVNTRWEKAEEELLIDKTNNAGVYIPCETI
ncbi:hypothetical protein VN97_g7035 [Penicillium thymicola]|uniref:Uncharacterized protein n=1 Tax=Penicillium thymicola TaxID=293382 RepID=A0AAI9X7Q9_PENTH|nr:hypothetical protein VN97_g7035 [Penicillium thymicola]